MGRLVPIQLDHEHGLLFTVSNTRLACAVLRQIGKLAAADNHGDAANLVRKGDLDGMTVLIWAGLQHEDRNLQIDTIEKWLDKAIFQDGRPITEVGRPILTAMKAANLIDFIYEPAKPEAEGSGLRPPGAERMEAVSRDRE